MPKLTINGKEVEVPAGTNLIEAAKGVGAEVPHFCYHPGLSVAGNCRMCLVEIEKAPKLQIACNTAVTEGMVVFTESEKVKKARQGVMEFLLLNHPIDCPICDCAGECYLQDYYMEHDVKASRFQDQEKNIKEKASEIGPHVMLDKERCVLCSRCVRFTDEISKSNELGIFGRGSTEEIDLAPGKRLDNDYSGNVVDLCPVGALTDKDFRFKSRPWFLKEHATVCAGCSMGCNISFNSNPNPYNKVGQKRSYRIYPRENREINQFWICDEGRYSYHAFDENRLELASSKGSVVSADYGLSMAAEALQKEVTAGSQGIGILLSPQMTNEELKAWKELAASLGISKVGFGDDLKRMGKEDHFLIKADKNPNTRGAQDLGIAPLGKALLEEAVSGALKFLVVVEHELTEAAAIAAQVPFVLGLYGHQADWQKSLSLCLPRALYVEQEGSFTNVQGTTQHFKRALEPLGEGKSASDWALALAKRLLPAKVVG